MLNSKFLVSVTRKSYGNFPESLPCIRQMAKKASASCSNACRKTKRVKDELIIPRRCKEYREKLATCPKPSHELLCCKKFFEKPAPKCVPKIVGDDYQKAYRDTVTRSKEITKDIENELRTIVEQLEKDLQLAKNNEAIECRQLSCELEQKLRELMTLDSSFGTLKRMTVLSLNDEATQAFKGLQCDVVPSVKHIESMCEELRRDLSICIDRVRCLIISCRKCKTPQELAKCVEENGTEATKMLDKTEKDARERLNEIKAYREEIWRNHKNAKEEVVQMYREKMTALSKYLERCIVIAKENSK